MRRPRWIKLVRTRKIESRARPNARRDRLAVLFAFATIVGVGLMFFLAKDTQFLMPGPLTSAHGAIETCNTCHTRSGRGNLSWLRGFVSGDRHGDSKACLTCHAMPDTAFNAHGASAEVLKQSTERLSKVAVRTPAPLPAHAQSVASPTSSMRKGGLHCASCHQEHQGANFNLKKISSEQCRSCHVVKFDSFDGHHPPFEAYPFKRRTRIIYDHAGHFGKHFPEMAKKDPSKRIPDTCSICHNSRDDRRVMAVAPFEKTCATCHMDQIAGKERVSGPKGISFLSLPGLDLQTLQKRRATIGEWPNSSEAEFTPFMKLMIGRTARGRAMIKAVNGLNLQDLTAASDEQIKAVTALAWEIKRLFHGLISGKASDVLAGLSVADGTKLGTPLVADLTASIPRDVLIRAHQQWLPNLDTEMVNRKDVGDQEQGEWVTTTTEAKSTVDSDTATVSEPARPDRRTPPESAPDVTIARSDDGKKTLSTDALPRGKGADQTDDLLFPTPEELRGMNAAQSKGTAEKSDIGNTKPGRAASANASTPPPSETAVVKPQASAVTSTDIENNVDPENWADNGGWYRQDYAIFYRPTGHKDKFMQAWLLLTGPEAPKGAANSAAKVFDALINKDAPGSCAKCHSVDDIHDQGRIVNFSPPSAKSKQGHFTQFIHEPHFGMLETRGCLTCHQLQKGRSYLQSYEKGDPHEFASNFAAVRKNTCQTCHTSGMARQDCLLCHKYHVNGVSAPIMSTKNPSE